ncbi:hypothetical protein [Paracoccus sp. TOH]|uniref:hypothetical protein n=1 Tax=Paracoccus sp. TOH TaxID=1263728 RepID=UPI0025B04387|nr:hypothetical protein [Paracoccus sp. TOH]WJS83532.1 hypothetical protein NBE95_07045 [Paracoccus sp. TOH]
MTMAQPETKINPSPMLRASAHITDARDDMQQVSNLLFAAHLLMEGMKTREADAVAEVIGVALSSLGVAGGRLDLAQEVLP